MQDPLNQNLQEVNSIEMLSNEQIESMDNDVLKRLLQSVRRDKEDLASGMAHKDHGSHSNSPGGGE